MGCGASTNSVVDYAHGVAPGGRRAISSSDVLDSSMDSLESGMEHQEVPTPVMDSMWALRVQAAETADLKEFMSLLGLQQRDMHGGMKAFSKLTKERVVSVERMSSAMQLPGGKDSRLLRHLFQAASSSSTDRSCQGMTFRTFMFFHALLRQAPLGNAERIKFWYIVMKLSGNASSGIHEATTLENACNFLRDAVCSKCSGVDSYLPRAASKVLGNVKKAAADLGFSHGELIGFSAFLPLSSSCKASAVFNDMLTRLETVFKFVPRGPDAHMDLKIRAHFFDRADELSQWEGRLRSGQSVTSKSNSHWKHSFSGQAQQVQHKSYLPENRRDRDSLSSVSSSSRALRDISNENTTSRKLEASSVPIEAWLSERSQPAKTAPNRSIASASSTPALMLKPKKRRGGDEQLQRLRARDDAAMSAMSARGERDTSRSMISHGGTDGGTSCCLSSSSEQCDKSIPELQAFEKSLECLAQHWEKDKKRMEEFKAAKKAFVEGRQALPVVSEGKQAAASNTFFRGRKVKGPMMIFSPQRAPKARSASSIKELVHARGASDSLSAAGCGWNSQAKVRSWLDPGAKPMQEENPWETGLGLGSPTPVMNAIEACTNMSPSPRAQRPTLASISGGVEIVTGAGEPGGVDEVPADKPWLKRLNALEAASRQAQPV